MIFADTIFFQMGAHGCENQTLSILISNLKSAEILYHGPGTYILAKIDTYHITSSKWGL